MYSVWVSPPAIIVISLGFAGLLGEQIRQLRSRLNQNKGKSPRFDRFEALLRSHKHQLAAVLALVGLVLLSPLSLPPVTQWISWTAASLVVALFAIRPKVLPTGMFTCRFAWQYASFSMLVAALWNLLAGPGLPYLVLGLVALFAALLSWKRSQTTSA
jgi:hypothetical protein